MKTEDQENVTADGQERRLPIASLVRSLGLLEELARVGGRSSVAQLIAETSLERATVQRILRTLLASGYVQRTGRGEYSIAPRGYVLGVMLAKGTGLATALEPTLRALQERTGESVHAGALDGTDVVSVAHIPSGRMLTFNFPVGTRIPAYASTLGRAILAYLPQEHANQVLQRSDRRMGTLTTKSDLRKELDRIREQGFAVARDEIEPGLAAVAAPVLGPSGAPLAAINVVVPSSYIDQAGGFDQLIEPVLEMSRDVSGRLGWPVPAAGS